MNLQISSASFRKMNTSFLFQAAICSSRLPSPPYYRSLHTFSKAQTFSSSSEVSHNRIHSTIKTEMATSIVTHPLTHTITLPKQSGHASVEIIGAPGLADSEFRKAIDSSLFKQWLENLQSNTGILSRGDMSLKRVLIQGVDMFGARIGFLKFKADILDNETGNKVPGIVFARGPAVAVLILLHSGEDTYVILTEQVRVPVGKLILELPAGMLDDDKGDFVGTAVREVEEETGIKLKTADMVDLTALLDSSTGRRVFPSPGGCDEELSLFLYQGTVDKEVITTLHGKQTGLREHGELIKVCVVPYERLWRVTADAKVLAAIALYEMAKRDGLLSK